MAEQVITTHTLVFSKENNTAVVILSNLAPDYRIPATVLGVKLLLETIED